MVLPNVGMVIMAALSSVEPSDMLKGLLVQHAQDADLQGIPPIVKYHAGWKTWKVDVADTAHRIKTKEDAHIEYILSMILVCDGIIDEFGLNYILLLVFYLQ